MSERSVAGSREREKASGPVVLTLDAGGTNFVFNAIRDGALLLPRGVALPAAADDLEASIRNILTGFRRVMEKTAPFGRAEAVSFAFPGPADYENGVIGDLENLPAYRGGVELGPILEKELGLPVFINNDGDLFALGAALHGELEELNRALEARSCARRLRSVVGMTLGTGWGCGFVQDGRLFTGSSSTGMEIGLCPGPDARAIEETVSRGGIVELYRESLSEAGLKVPLDPSDPALAVRIAESARSGEGPESEAARRAFSLFGESFAWGVSWAVNLLDPDLVLVGGGLAGAWDLFFPAALEFLRGRYESGRVRVYKRVFDLGDPGEREEFLKEETDVAAKKKTAVGRTRLDTAEAIMLGAYRLAVDKVSAGKESEGA